MANIVVQIRGRARGADAMEVVIPWVATIAAAVVAAAVAPKLLALAPLPPPLV